MDDETVYRIEFTIQRQKPGKDDFTEIGFGSSGAWSDLDQAMNIASSAVQSGQWETERGMPSPELVLADLAHREDD